MGYMAKESWERRIIDILDDVLHVFFERMSVEDKIPENLDQFLRQVLGSSIEPSLG
jgi:hypothetical protein